MFNIKSEVTNYVIVVNYVDGQTLFNSCLLGWDNKDDWFSTDTFGEEIMMSTGCIKENQLGLIEIDRWVSIYACDTISDLRDHAEGGIEEGYDCTVCKLEKRSDGDYNLIPV